MKIIQLHWQLKYTSSPDCKSNSTQRINRIAESLLSEKKVNLEYSWIFSITKAIFKKWKIWIYQVIAHVTTFWKCIWNVFDRKRGQSRVCSHLQLINVALIVCITLNVNSLIKSSQIQLKQFTVDIDICHLHRWSQTLS